MRAKNTWRALGWIGGGGFVRVWGEAARVFLKTRQTRYLDGQSSELWWAIWTLWPRRAICFLYCSIPHHSLRECTALSHIGSRMTVVLVYGSRQRFSTSANPSQGGTFKENFARWLAFHSLYACSQAKTDGEGPSLFSTQNKIWHQNSLRKVWMRRNVSPLNTVGTHLLLLGEMIDSLPTKNFVELRSNDVGTTAGRLIPGKV